MSLQR